MIQKLRWCLLFQYHSHLGERHCDQSWWSSTPLLHWAARYLFLLLLLLTKYVDFIFFFLVSTQNKLNILCSCNRSVNMTVHSMNMIRRRRQRTAEKAEQVWNTSLTHSTERLPKCPMRTRQRYIMCYKFIKKN